DRFTLHLRTDRSRHAQKLVPDAHQAAQKIAPKSSEELVEVHRRGTQDGIERIAGNTLQPIVLQPVFRLQMSDAWLDRGAAFHPSPECSGRPASSSLVCYLIFQYRLVYGGVCHRIMPDLPASPKNSKEE